MLSARRILCQKARQGTNYLSLLTPKQKAIELDRYHFRVVYGGRQWGKSFWNGVSKRRNAIAETTALAIAPTIHKARDLLWPVCERLNRECDAKIELRVSDSQLVMPNGAKVQLMGLSTLAEAEKIRGFTPTEISLEECGTYRDELLSYAVDACARPALMKWWRRGGRGLTAIGTPSKNVKTYWHGMCLGETGASVHFATVRDNPHIPDAEAYLRQVLYDNRKLGWTERTPEYRREYLGEFCPDSEALPYGGWNGVVFPQKTAPEQGWTVMGVDFGQHQPNAWVVFRLTTERATSEDRSRIYTMHKIHMLHAYKQAGMTTHQVDAHSKMLAHRFHPNVIVGDSSGGGAQSIADLQRVYQLPIVAAKKAGFKKDRIWMFGSMLSNQTIICYDETKPWQDEARVTPWNEDKDDHHCLVAETLVETARGAVRIDSVRAGDMVKTRSGTRRVLHSWLARKAAPVLTLTTAAGRTLVGTGNHPVMVPGRGWVRLDQLRGGDPLCILANTSSWTESASSARATTSGQEESVTTSPSGRSTTAPCRRATTSTTSTTTRSTMTSATCSCSPRASIKCTTCAIRTRSKPNASSAGDASLRRSDSSSTVPGHVSALPGERAEWTRSSVTASCAEQRSSAASTLLSAPAVDRVASLSDTGRVSDVFDLEVEGAHEFTANGIVVHNSGYSDHCLDAGLYALEYLMAHLSETEAEPMPGTPEWEERESKRRWEERLRWMKEQA